VGQTGKRARPCCVAGNIADDGRAIQRDTAHARRWNGHSTRVGGRRRRMALRAAKTRRACCAAACDVRGVASRSESSLCEHAASRWVAACRRRRRGVLADASVDPPLPLQAAACSTATASVRPACRLWRKTSRRLRCVSTNAVMRPPSAPAPAPACLTYARRQSPRHQRAAGHESFSTTRPNQVAHSTCPRRR
jgi:hypothetical protein